MIPRVHLPAAGTPVERAAGGRVFTPVVLNDPAPTSPAQKGMFSLVTIGLQGGTRFVSNWLIGIFSSGVVLGAVASATALAFTLNTLWPASAQPGASKFLARARGAGDDAQIHAVARHLGARVLMISGVLAVAAPFAWTTLDGGKPWEGVCISGMVLTVGTSQFARGVHFGAGQIARGTKVDVLASALGIAGTLALLLLGVRSVLLTLPLTVTMGIYSLLCWPWTANGRPEKALRREIDHFVTIAALGSIASAGMLQIAQVVARGISVTAAGQLAPALQLVTPISIVTTALTLVLYPSLARAYGAGDHASVSRQTDLATRAFLAVMVPVFGTIALMARPLIDVVWLGRYPGSAYLMPMFCVALLAQSVATPSVSSITSGPHRQMYYSLGLSQAGLVVAVLGWLTLVPAVGLAGVGLGYAVGSLVTSFGVILVAWRLGRQRWAGVLARLVGAIVVISGLSWWRQTQPPTLWADLLVAVAFGVITALGGLTTLRELWRARRRLVPPATSADQPEEGA